MKPYWSDEWLTVYQGDCREVMRSMEPESVHCVVTSPPYWGLRDYGTAGQLGLEATPEEYVANMVDVFREVRRVLRADGTVWLNLGDSYAGSWGAQSRGNHTGDDKTTLNGHEAGLRISGRQIAEHPNFGRFTGTRALSEGRKPKDLTGIPWMVAFALRSDGWYLRRDIIWHKPNPMPESVTDRPTTAHEYVFLLSRSSDYHYDAAAIAEPAVTPKDDPKLLFGERPDVGYPSGQAGRRRKSVPRGGFSGKTEAMPGRNAFRAVTETRNKRSVWTVATAPYPGAHYAVFPTALIEPMILAGSSERGVCPECRAPWVRQVLRTPNPSKEANVGADRSGGAARTSNPQTSAGMHRNGTNVAAPSPVTTGWAPSCSCCDSCVHSPQSCADHQPIPATILDPFAGSGTTGLVAQSLGRRAILIDLSTDYLSQIMARNAQIPLGAA